jgi:hypothetical protein
MHTTKGKHFLFHHHGDFSGNVEIVDLSTGKTVGEVAFEDLKTLVACHIMHERISAFEQMTPNQILGLEDPQ